MINQNRSFVIFDISSFSLDIFSGLILRPCIHQRLNQQIYTTDQLQIVLTVLTYEAATFW